MTKSYRLLMLFGLCLWIAVSTSEAGTTKIISLADGSIIKGEVIRMADGVFTVRTDNMGEVNIQDSDIVSIDSEATPSVNNNSLDKPIKTTDWTAGSQNLKEQVQNVQGDILANPAIMQDIQQLVNDPQIQVLLSDKDLINDILSYDPQRIQNNEKLNTLMNNPEMRALMEKIQQNMSSP